MRIADDIRQKVLAVGAKYGVTDIRVFGSYSRGEEKPGSDLDLLVSFPPKAGLLDLVGFGQDLEEALQIRVDVLTDGGISPHLAPIIRAEARPL